MTKNTALKRVVSAPYLVWAALFIVVPLIFVVYYSLVDAGGAFTLDYIRSIGRYKDIMLNSITSPEDGTVLAWDEATGCYWQLFVNGVAAETGISGIELEDGMSIVWYYSAFGDSLPEEISALPQAA